MYRARTIGAMVAVTAITLLCTPVAAHVSVEAGDGTAPDGHAQLVLAMPNERSTTSTVKLELQFPTDHPIATAEAADLDGWEVTVDERDLDEPMDVQGQEVTSAVDVVTWTATDGGIGPDEEATFAVTIGPIPETAERLVFRALQTYDDGEVVRWIDDDPDSEHPAPVLLIAEGEIVPEQPTDGDAHSDETATDETVTVETTVVAVEANGSVDQIALSESDAALINSLSASATATSNRVDDLERLAYAGIAIGIVALIAAVAAFLGARGEAQERYAEVRRPKDTEDDQ